MAVGSESLCGGGLVSNSSGGGVLAPGKGGVHGIGDGALELLHDGVDDGLLTGETLGGGGPEQEKIHPLKIVQCWLNIDHDAHLGFVWPDDPTVHNG